MAVVSTAVSDWPRDVTDASGNTLAELLDKAYTKSEKAAGHSKPPKAREGAGISVFPSSLDCRKRGKAPNRKITLLNGSHLSPSDQTSVLVFPDYKVRSSFR